MNKITKSIILSLIFLLILLYAAFSGVDKVAMRRESIEPDLIIQPTDLAEALDLSLSLGDGRRVDWKPLGWEV